MMANCNAKVSKKFHPVHFKKTQILDYNIMGEASVRTPCSREGCTKVKCDENVYCLKHQIFAFVDATVAANKKVCRNHIRGCRAQLDPDDSFSRCDTCRETERTRDQARRAAAAAAAQVSADATEKTCTTCCKVFPMDMFRGEKAGTITKTCRPCRDDNKKQDENRDREHRNALARVAEAKPEFKQKKRAYRDENPEKGVQYDLTSKSRRLENLGPEGYLAHNAAAQQAVWRTKNPEKYAAFNEKRRVDLGEFFKANYVRPSKNKNLEFTITEYDFASIAKEPCYYCGEMEKIEVDGEMVERGFNGLDRKDQTRGYVVDNCVSACNMCNVMKKSLHVDIFLKRVEHMISYNFPSEIDADRFPEVFCNHFHSAFTDYVYRCKQKNRVIEISCDDFSQLQSEPCYLCGKCTTHLHKNGIDRFDSGVGYVLKNCRPCCGECNYMKNDFDFQQFMDKLLAIYNHRILPNKAVRELTNYIVEPTTAVRELSNSFVEPTTAVRELSNSLVEVAQPIAFSIMHPSQKKSKEEIRENARIRKQKSRDHLLNTLGSEEYRRQHAEKTAEERRKKKAAAIVIEL